MPEVPLFALYGHTYNAEDEIIEVPFAACTSVELAKQIAEELQGEELSWEEDDCEDQSTPLTCWHMASAYDKFIHNRESLVIPIKIFAWVIKPYFLNTKFHHWAATEIV